MQFSVPTASRNDRQCRIICGSDMTSLVSATLEPMIVPLATSDPKLPLGEAAVGTFSRPGGVACSGYCGSFCAGRVTPGIEALMQLIEIDIKCRDPSFGDSDALGSQVASSYLGWIWSENC